MVCYGISGEGGQLARMESKGEGNLRQHSRPLGLVLTFSVPLFSFINLHILLLLLLSSSSSSLFLLLWTYKCLDAQSKLLLLLLLLLFDQNSLNACFNSAASCGKTLKLVCFLFSFKT